MKPAKETGLTPEREEFLQMLRNSEGIIFKVCHAFSERQTDIDDLYQDIAYNLWRAWPRYRHESDISTWVYTVARNTAVSHYRTLHRSSRPKFVTLEEDMCSQLNEESDNEQVVMLYEMIEHLPVTDRNIILLYLGHYTEKEIAQIVGKSAAAVKQQINRIKNKLRKQYEKNFKNRR